MSYLDQTGRKNPASIAAVVGVHLAVGYALLAGLGITVIPFVPQHTTVVQITEAPPPKPHPIDTQRNKLPNPSNTIPKPENPLKPDTTIIPEPTFDHPFTTSSGGGGGGVVLPPLDPPKPSLARDAQPGTNRLGWITTDDYPPGLIRQNVQGLVVISVMIGADGGVRSCLVTQSSGNKLLDDTTCRLYMKRAHFSPALDADGNPTTAQRTDRYRWQIPNE